MIEYLYVDEKRLNSYVTQFASEVADEKIPNWSFEASLTGPKIVGRQDRRTRPRSTHEKVNLLIKHLKSGEQLATSRPFENPDFCAYPEPVFRFRFVTLGASSFHPAKTYRISVSAFGFPLETARTVL